MESKTVLITGCSGGIGRCLAQGLKARGYRVFATARGREDLAALAGEGYEALPLDLEDPATIAAAVDEVLARTGGRLYGLINNAGYGQAGAVEDLTREALRRQFETNVFGPQELVNRVLPAMRRQGRGRIIQMSSLLGFVCLAYRGAYNASKYALEALSDTLRLELRDTDIHVVLVEPGPIVSRFRDRAYRAYRERIDAGASAHRDRYRAIEARLAGRGGHLPFTLPPEAVLRQVVRALEARRPKARYRVTVPAHVLAALKRLLPDRWLDAVLARVSDGGRR